MNETPEITTEDQIKCVEKFINFQHRFIECLENEPEVDLETAQHDLECLKAVHETLLFDYHLKTATLENLSRTMEAMTL